MADHVIPERYPFAETVGKDGAKCSTCHYLGKDGKTCRNKLYIKAEGTKKLGDKADRFCCMVWSKEARTE